AVRGGYRRRAECATLVLGRCLRLSRLRGWRQGRRLRCGLIRRTLGRLDRLALGFLVSLGLVLRHLHGPLLNRFAQWMVGGERLLGVAAAASAGLAVRSAAGAAGDAAAAPGGFA